MPTKNPQKIAATKSVKLPASVELTITYPAKLFHKEVDKGMKDTLDKKIQKIVGRSQDASGCDTSEVRGAKRNMHWRMIRRNRIVIIEKAIAALGIPSLKVTWTYLRKHACLDEKLETLLNS